MLGLGISLAWPYKHPVQFCDWCGSGTCLWLWLLEWAEMYYALVPWLFKDGSCVWTAALHPRRCEDIVLCGAALLLCLEGTAWLSSWHFMWAASLVPEQLLQHPTSPWLVMACVSAAPALEFNKPGCLVIGLYCARVPVG